MALEKAEDAWELQGTQIARDLRELHATPALRARWSSPASVEGPASTSFSVQGPAMKDSRAVQIGKD